ncbi:MAG: metalloregulator ArsR/SmtB family transcription factor [Candidatus Delongbacteria bacterium]
MTESTGLIVARALADPARLAVLRALLERPHYVEELAGRLGLAASTLVFHLKKLEEAGLVSKSREQYFSMYSVCWPPLERPLLELVTGGEGADRRERERLAGYCRRVLQTFAPAGRVERLPVQQKKRRLLLEEFAALLEPGREYPERALNELFAVHHADYCTVRRELVDAGLLLREQQVYRLNPAWTPAGPSWLREMAAGPAPARNPEAGPAAAGVYCITHLASGRRFIARASGVESRLRSQRAQLELGLHRCAALQEDWSREGAAAFRLEVLATLEPAEESAFQRGRRLSALEREWRVRLDCPGDYDSSSSSSSSLSSGPSS